MKFIYKYTFIVLLLSVSGWSYGQNNLVVELNCETDCYDAIINGGEAPYIVEWQRLQGSTFVTLSGWPKDIENINSGEEDFCNPEIGKYKLIVKDALGDIVIEFLERNECAIDSEYFLQLPNPTTGNGGSINVLASGGEGPYSYSWNYSKPKEAIEGCGVPKGLEVEILSETSVKVTWAKYSEAKFYRVHYVLAGGGFAKAINTDGNVNEMILSDLKPNSTYRVRVRSNCPEGNSAYTNYLQFKPTEVSEYSGQGNEGIQLETTASFLNDLEPGTYCYTMTNASCCKVTECIEIPCVFETEISVTAAECGGGAGGAISITPIDGAPPINYTWSNGLNTNSITDLEAGIYSVTAVDNNNCYAIHEISVSEDVDWNMEVYTNNSSFCSSTGAIYLLLSDEGKPYQFEWEDNGSTTNYALKLGVGTHCVTITDQNDCRVIECYEVAPLPPITIDGSFSNFCDGQENVQMNLTVSGGVSPYSFLWNTGSTVEDPLGLPPGINAVLVTDAAGCRNWKIFNVGEYSMMTAEAEVPVFCSNEEFGPIVQTVSGGQPPYTYAWVNGFTTKDNPEATAGENSVTIYDANGCKINESYFIHQNLDQFLFPRTIHPCFEADNGSIEMLVFSGTEPYTFEWSNNMTGSTIDNLAEGTYTLTFTDGAGCQSIQDIELVEKEPIVSAVNLESTCAGGNTGSITLEISEGFGPLTIQWENGVSGPSLQNLAPGEYCVTITEQSSNNSAGCVYEECWRIPGITNFQVNLVDVDNASECGVLNTSCDGSIDISVIPSNANYSYDWSNGSNSQDLSGLCSGLYIVTVTDDQGCTKVRGVNICCCQESIYVGPGNDEPEFINGDCYGESPFFEITPPIVIDGQANSPNSSIEVTVSGGTGNFACRWTGPNGFTSNLCGSISELALGQYCLTVDDGCNEEIECFTIVDCDLVDLNVSGSIADTCPEFTAGIISVSVTGGNSPYQFNWDNGRSGALLTNLAQGTNCVTVTDKNGCFESECFTIGLKDPTFEDSFCQRTFSCNGRTRSEDYPIETTFDCNIRTEYCELVNEERVTELPFLNTYILGCTVYGLCQDGMVQVIEEGQEVPGPILTDDSFCQDDLGCVTDLCEFEDGLRSGPFTFEFCARIEFITRSDCNEGLCVKQIWCGNTIMDELCGNFAECPEGPGKSDDTNGQITYSDELNRQSINNGQSGTQDDITQPKTQVVDAFASKVSPNPFSDIFTIEIVETVETEVMIVMTDLVGKTIATYNRDVKPGTNTIEIYEQGLNPGVYFIQIIENNELKRYHKIVKQ